MADQTPTPTPTPKKLTAAEAAKQVHRAVPKAVLDKEGKPTGETEIKKVAVKAEEVLAFKDYGTHVVVTTTDGQKLTSAQGE